MGRAEISRRLKAARWLRGGVDEKGRTTPLSPEALAQLEPLRRNGISANAVAEIERMVKDARPMELREIREALDLPEDWFDEPSGIESGILARLDAIEATLSRRGADAWRPAPAGELGRRAEGFGPSDQDRREGDSDRDTGAQPDSGR